MANQTIMQGLLESLMQRPQQEQQQKGTLLTNLISQPNPLAATVANMLPGQLANVGTAARGLFGIAPQVNVQDIIAKNPELMNTSEGLIKLSSVANASGNKEAALQFSLMAADKKAEETQYAQSTAATQLKLGTALTRVREMQAAETDPVIQNELNALSKTIASGYTQADKVEEAIKNIYDRNKKEKPATTTFDIKNWTTPDGQIQAVASNNQGKVNLPPEVAAQYNLPAGLQDAPKGWKLAPSESAAKTDTREVADPQGLLNYAVMTGKIDPNDQFALDSLRLAVTNKQVTNTDGVNQFVADYAKSPVNQQKKQQLAIRTVQTLAPTLAAGEEALNILNDPNQAKFIGTTWSVTSDFPIDSPQQRLKQVIQPMLSNVWLQQVQSLKQEAGVGTSAFSSNAEGERVMAAAGNLNMPQSAEELQRNVEQIQLASYNLRNITQGQPVVVAWGDPVYPPDLIVPGSLNTQTGEALYQVTPGAPPMKVVFRQSTGDALSYLRPAVRQ